MKGLKPIQTVEDLILYLQACPPKASLLLMPEDAEGDGYPIGGVLQLQGTDGTPEVWILIDEGDPNVDWSIVSESEDQSLIERPGDMGVLPEVVEEDIVQIRGKLRSA